VARADLPPRVSAFIASHFASVDELQTLVALMDAPDRWWDAESVAGEVRLAPRDAALALERLAGRNLLEVRITTDVRYQYHPGSETLAKAVREAIDAYRADPVAVVRVIYSELQRIRDFADAFRIKR
jgi:hypothetical protein